jgi:D-alanine-D-alanine ligase-like ATP-grasp enzyme
MIHNFRPKIRSRHPSHAPLRQRGALPLFPFKSVIRFGSTTVLPDTIDNGGSRIEINTVQAVKNSSSKYLMKQCFTDNQVKTADWWTCSGNNYTFTFRHDEGIQNNTLENLPYPIISKSFFGSRNQGNKKHDNAEQLRAWLVGKDLNGYIFEKYYNYIREYRLHISKNSCFYSCRKMLKEDTAEEDKWYRNDVHCVWILEENELFDKPKNWDKVVAESVKALNAVGLDIGAVDVRIQGAKDQRGNVRDEPDFIIVEINSAPSFGDVTIVKYKIELANLLNQKHNGR